MTHVGVAILARADNREHLFFERHPTLAAPTTRPPPMAKDQQGLLLSGAPASAEAFDRAVADYYGLTGDPVGALKPALERDPAFALGGVAIAGLYMIGGFRS